ncbi:MAG: SDR family oxidoreductase [Erysipelothrix sp.]|jgi:NAD(P)-dependent dehydrogenase (short-subunit alcohol dehydrogenase family)|nr:SDR family oxidoreductase [Erysipelothrix sp.]
MKFSEYESLDLSHKIILITGANAGLGYEAALFFASRNATVIAGVRSMQRGEQAKSKILEIVPNASIHFLECDLSNSKSIDAFASVVKESFPPIDILLNNAGIMAVPYALTKDNFESQFGVNHLGHFRLTALLYSHLNDHARIINVSSMAHMQATIDLNDPHYTSRSYQSFKAYAQSKLANLLFTHELNKRMKNDSHQLLALSAHPGVAMTSLFDKVETASWMRFIKPIFGLFAASAKQGSYPLIVACLDPNALPDMFYGPKSGKKNEVTTNIKMKSLAHDASLQKGLWDLSNQQCSLKFLED